MSSEPGRGSCFQFTAKFRLPKNAAPAPVRTELSQIAGLPVLIVDDNATNRQILSESLANWGLAPRSAADARSALRELKAAAAINRPFQLLLLDAMMPEIDGFGLAAEIKKSPELSGMLLMMLSSADQSRDIHRCRELGIQTYLVKPLGQSELLDSILLVLDRRAAAEREPTTPVTTSTRPLRILLAEDNAVNRELATEMLRKFGHEITTAANGREAVIAFERERPDLVLMDIQMPEVDGFEATAQIRAFERKSATHTPIVALTANALKGDRDICLARGMDDYVTKPIRRNELGAAIERAMATEKIARTRARISADTAPPETDARRINRTAIEAEFGGTDLLQQMAQLFLESTPPLVEKARAALASHDAPSLVYAAHTIKGSVQNFGAKTIAHLAGMLEESARTGDLPTASRLWPEFEVELQAVSTELADIASAK